MSKSSEAHDEAVLSRKLEKDLNEYPKFPKIMPKDIRVEDEVVVEFTMRVNAVTAGGDKTGQVFGFTENGMCVSAPISAIVERFPRFGNGGDEVDHGEVF